MHHTYLSIVELTDVEKDHSYITDLTFHRYEFEHNKQVTKGKTISKIDSLSA